VTAPLVLTTAAALGRRRDALWLYGPYGSLDSSVGGVSQPGDVKAYGIALSDYLPLIAEVERAAGTPERAAQWLRRLYYSRPLRGAGSRFDGLLATDPARAAAPVCTTDGVRQSTLDALVRVGSVTVPGAAALGSVEMSHVFVLLDRKLNGMSDDGKWVSRVGDIQHIFSWSGDLGSAWVAYNDRRQKEKAAAEALHTGSWKEPTAAPADLATPLGWLEEAIRGRSAVDDMVGDLDAVVLSQDVLDRSSDTPISDLIGSYYTNPGGGSTPGHPSVADRFALFLTRTDPPIPHDTGPVRLRPEAEEFIRDAIYAAARAFLVKTRGYVSSLIGQNVWSDLDSPWGTAMFDELARRFRQYLETGLAGGAPAWPAAEDPKETPYRGYGTSLPAAPALDELEAFAQFHLNWREPHRPLPAGRRTYRPLSLRDPAGNRARILGAGPQPGTTRVKLGSPVSFDGVRPGRAGPNDHRDLAVFAEDTARASKTYRILAVDPAAAEIVVDGTPAWTGTARWRVQRRVRLVMIDPYFPRMGGPAAVASGATVTLDGTPDLARLVANFDTIALLDDPGRLSRTYRIVAVDPALPAVTVDAPTGLPPKTGSRWLVPAGATDVVRAEQYAFDPRTDGCDHYGGAVFVVHADAVQGTYDTFTSYTSSKNSGESLSSCYGNGRYTVSSYRNEQSTTRNFCFAVTDLRGDAGPPWYDQLTDLNDTIREARYYFDGVSAKRTPRPGATPDMPVNRDANGKKLIRIHYGHPGGTQTGSDGCMVSPRIYELRSKVIELHQTERVALGLAADPHLAQVGAATTHADSIALWSSGAVTYGRFSDRIQLELVCVRPDQRQTSPT
jgi:hypothetical protein